MTTPFRAQCSCGGCSGHAHSVPEIRAVTRRKFIVTAGMLAVGGAAVRGWAGELAREIRPGRAPRFRKPLRVQPVLTYDTPKRREATSWRSWGGIHSDDAAAAERSRIETELAGIARAAGVPLEFQPVQLVKTVEPAAALARGDHDVMLIYGAGGSVRILEALTDPQKWNLMFLRHDPGPAYLWYEVVHPRFLRKTVDDYGQPGWDVNDVVVDSQLELSRRLRALHGLKNTLGKKIVAIDGPSGWGAGMGKQAPEIARTLWKMELVTYPYAQLGPRIKEARGNPAVVKACAAAAAAYLQAPGVSLHTTREFVENAFVLREVLNDVMEEAGTDAITIRACMGTIMGLSQTTACLPLSLLNDDGYLAFCESDFVVIPSGVLLHYISGLPVFLNDPTFPHDKIVTLAHCTAPRKMDGRTLEPAKVLTHFESDYGAAPKVEMKIGQECTNLVPDFASRKWVGFHGTIVANPFHEICRSQIDVRINGDGAALLQEMKGFHWMMSYGDYLAETGYALRKVGVEFLDVSRSKSAA